MPIYEFYCSRCNTIYKFLSKKIDTETVPDCPKCKGIKLQRRVSLFAAVSGGKKGEADNDMPPIDESKMERAMGMLAKEAEGMNEDDPRQAAQLMRKLSDATGLKMGSGMEEAMHRLERGEDPEKIEQEMGNIFESEEPFTFEGAERKASRRPEPAVDETLYKL